MNQQHCAQVMAIAHELAEAILNHREAAARLELARERFNTLRDGLAELRQLSSLSAPLIAILEQACL